MQSEPGLGDRQRCLDDYPGPAGQLHDGRAAAQLGPRWRQAADRGLGHLSERGLSLDEVVRK